MLGHDQNTLRVGLAVPASGVLGQTGPVAIAASVLAAEEINEKDGVRGKRIELVPIDAGTLPEIVAREVDTLLAAKAIDSACGFHTSDVHRRLEKVTSGRIPYLFTPPHEGGSRLSGVALLGESPFEQMLPVARHLADGRRRRRWALIGNDYIWPRAINKAAKKLLTAHGSEVVLSESVPFGEVNGELLIDRIHGARADAVLLSLVGRDLATFNRVFAESTLAERVIRASGSLDETGLLEVGGDDSGELYSTMRWFASDPDVDCFRERYFHRFGAHAPGLGVYSSGCYAGLRLLGTLSKSGLLEVDTVAESAARLGSHRRIHLARAQGLELVGVT